MAKMVQMASKGRKDLPEMTVLTAKMVPMAKMVQMEQMAFKGRKDPLEMMVQMAKMVLTELQY